MHLLQRITRLIVISSCLFAAGVSCTQAEGEKQSPTASPSDQATMMNPQMMNPMMGMMNPQMMNPMMGMMNPQMMNPQMMNPMMGMMNPQMMNPMMGMMSGGMGMPGVGANGSNPHSQMPGGGQMMDPKQYEQLFNQWTEMMKNRNPQTSQ